MRVLTTKLNNNNNNNYYYYYYKKYGKKKRKKKKEKEKRACLDDLILNSRELGIRFPTLLKTQNSTATGSAIAICQTTPLGLLLN